MVASSLDPNKFRGHDLSHCEYRFSLHQTIFIIIEGLIAYCRVDAGYEFSFDQQTIFITNPLIKFSSWLVERSYAGNVSSIPIIKSY